MLKFFFSGDFTFCLPGRVAGPEVGPGRKWQGLGPALSIASAATACMLHNPICSYLPGGSKNVPPDKTQFLDNRQRFFTKISKIVAEGVFNNYPENFNKIFSLLQVLQLLQYFIPYFKIIPKKCTVTCNIQCSALLNSFSQSTF